MQRELDTVREENEQLFEEKQQLQDVSDRYDRVVRVLGETVVDDAVQQDIQEQKALEEKRQMEQMPTEEWSCKNMKKHIYDESNGLSYRLHGDYYLPDLAVNEEEPTYGKYGMLRKQFLKEHKPARYQYLLMTGKLTGHLNQVDQDVREKVETLVKQIAEKHGVTEELKMQDQMKWVGLMNNIKVCAEEIVLKEIIYM